MIVELPLEGMTWGELRTFVAYGKHEEDSEEVFVDLDHSTDEPFSLCLFGVVLPNPEGD